MKKMLVERCDRSSRAVQQVLESDGNTIMSMGSGQAALDLLAQDATTEELTRDE